MHLKLSKDEFEALAGSISATMPGLQALLNSHSTHRGSRICQELRVVARTAKDKNAAAVARTIAQAIRTADTVSVEVTSEEVDLDLDRPNADALRPVAGTDSDPDFAGRT